METVDEPDEEEYHVETPNEPKEGSALEPDDLSFLGDDKIKEKPMP